MLAPWRVCFEKRVYKQKTSPRTTCHQNVHQDYRNLGLVVPCTLFFKKGTTICILHCVQVRFLNCTWWQNRFKKSKQIKLLSIKSNAVMFSRCCCWLLLYSAMLRTWADSLCLHVILHEWLAFYGVFLNIHWSIHSAVWLLHVTCVATKRFTTDCTCLCPYLIWDVWMFFCFVFIGRFDISVEQLI